jgi:hypothetical protein
MIYVPQESDFCQMIKGLGLAYHWDYQACQIWQAGSSYHGIRTVNEEMA